MNRKHTFLSLVIITFISVFCVSDIYADDSVNLIKGKNLSTKMAGLELLALIGTRLVNL